MARKAKNLELWCYENSRGDLLDEWDSERNKSLTFSEQPSDVEYNTPLTAYWKCHIGHEWGSPVASRTIFGLNCPTCNPEMDSLPIGAEYGCLTIIGKEKDSFGIVDGPTYRCRCKCGMINDFSEFDFLEKKHRYCTDKTDDLSKKMHPDLADKECGLIKKQNAKKLASYKRIKDENYDIDYTNTVHESLEVLECINDNYAVLSGYTDRRKLGGGYYKVYKLYKCRCYLCGKEYEIKSSDFSINPPPDYGIKAGVGYYSDAKCNCHKISSFQWIIAKILEENKVPYRVEVSFPDLKGIENINLLRYDFSIFNEDKSIKCLIECQGEQHYGPVDEFGGEAKFKSQQKNDELKRVYAREHNIPLYEISYKMKKYEKVEEFLKSKGII